MRAVSLSDEKVQKLVGGKLVPLKLVIKAGGDFPDAFPALRRWKLIYKIMAGDGFTGCVVASADGEVNLADTGSAMVWELFDSTAYDAGKFHAMLTRGIARQAAYAKLTTKGEIWKFKWDLSSKVKKEGEFQLPPKGFSMDKALKIFELTGDYVPPEKK